MRMDMVAMPPWILFQGVITVVVATTTITTRTKSIVIVNSQLLVPSVIAVAWRLTASMDELAVPVFCGALVLVLDL